MGQPLVLIWRVTLPWLMRSEGATKPAVHRARRTSFVNVKALNNINSAATAAATAKEQEETGMHLCNHVFWKKWAKAFVVVVVVVEVTLRMHGFFTTVHTTLGPNCAHELGIV